MLFAVNSKSNRQNVSSARLSGRSSIGFGNGNTNLTNDADLSAVQVNPVLAELERELCDAVSFEVDSLRKFITESIRSLENAAAASEVKGSPRNGTASRPTSVVPVAATPAPAPSTAPVNSIRVLPNNGSNNNTPRGGFERDSLSLDDRSVGSIQNNNGFINSNSFNNNNNNNNNNNQNNFNNNNQNNFNINQNNNQNNNNYNSMNLNNKMNALNVAEPSSDSLDFNRQINLMNSGGGGGNNNNANINSVNLGNNGFNNNNNMMNNNNNNNNMMNNMNNNNNVPGSHMSVASMNSNNFNNNNNNNNNNMGMNMNNNMGMNMNNNNNNMNNNNMNNNFNKPGSHMSVASIGSMASNNNNNNNNNVMMNNNNNGFNNNNNMMMMNNNNGFGNGINVGMGVTVMSPPVMSPSSSVSATPPMMMMSPNQQQPQLQLQQPPAMMMMSPNMNSMPRTMPAMSTVASSPISLNSNNKTSLNTGGGGGGIRIMPKLVTNPTVSSVVQFNTMEEAALIDLVLDAVRNKRPDTVVDLLKTVDLNQLYVIERGCWALMNIATFAPEIKTRIGEIGGCGVLVSILSRYGSTVPSLSDQVCAAMVNLTLNDAWNVSKFHEANVYEALVNCMANLGYCYPALTEKIFWVIYLMTVNNNEACQLFGQLGACELILSLLQRHGLEIALTEKAFWALLNLTLTNGENKKRIGGVYDNCKIIVNTINTTLLSSLNMAELGCKLLASVCSNSAESALNFGLSGGCEVVVMILQQSSNKPAVLDKALKAILHLTINNTTNKQKILMSNGCAIIMYLLRELVSSPTLAIPDASNGTNGSEFIDDTTSGTGLVELFCRVIASLAASHPDITKRFGADGICEQISIILKRYGSNFSLAENVFILSTNISSSDIDNKKQLTMLRVGEDIVKIMQFAGVEKTSLLDKALRALLGLISNNPDYKSRLGEAEACETILFILRSIPVSETTIIEYGFRVLFNLTANHPDNTRRCIQAEACETLVKIMAVLGLTQANIAEQACRVIQTLSANSPENKLRLCNAGVCDVLVFFLQNNNSSVANLNVAEQSCAAILSLASSTETIQKLGQANACNAIVYVLSQLGFTYPQVAEKGIKALVNLSSNNVMNKKVLMECGTGQVLAVIMNGPGSANTTIAEHACRVVINLASNSMENQHQLSDAGLCEIIIRVISQVGTSNPTFAEQACRAVIALTTDNMATTAKFGECGACETLIFVLTNLANNNNVSIIEKACWAILNLMQNNFENRQRFLQAGSVPLLLQIANSDNYTTMTKSCANESLKLLQSG